MQVTRRLTGLAVALVAAVALPVTLAQPAQAACASGTYPPSSCAPGLTMTGPSSAVTLAVATPAWRAVTFGAPISYYQLRYTRATWNGGFGGWVYPSGWQHLTSTSASLSLTPGNTYCFSARGIDTANRVGAWSRNRCATRPLDDRSLAVSSAWTRGTSRNYYLGTYTLTRSGSPATRTGAVAQRIAVVGVRCSTCGTVGVYMGTTLLGRLNFSSSTTQYRAVLATGPFSRRTGTITLRNLTPGKRVILDGLAVIRY